MLIRLSGDLNLKRCLLFASWAKVAVPLTNMWRWFKVVMAVVRFLLAVSSCLMSLVISFTYKYRSNCEKHLFGPKIT